MAGREANTTEAAARLAELATANLRLKQEIAERERAEDALRRSEEQARALFENSPDAIFVEDESGDILDVNDAACRLHGMERASLLGRNVTEMVPPSERERVRRDFAGWFAKGMEFYEGKTLRADGSEAPVEIRARTITYRGRRAVLLHVRDVSERVATEQALRRSQEQFHHIQKMEALVRLAGGVAHDFNNLLTTVLGCSSLVRDQLDADDPARGDLEEVLKAAERAADLTQRLLAFGRRQIIAPVPLCLNSVVRDMERILRRTLGEDIELLTRCDDHLGTVRADASQLEQIIMNLAVNARDAMPDGGTLVIRTDNAAWQPRAGLVAASAPPMGAVRLTVRDTGTGMPPEVREHMFEPFFTTKGAGRGTGLGLSSVYGIVQQSGGYIEFDTETGSGTEFRIYLPRADEKPESLERRRESAAPEGRGETVLVVEDEDTVRRLTARLLKRLGYNVLMAGNAGEALLICERHGGPIDLVLSDVVMPRMSGPELMARLRRVRRDFGVVFMTGFAQDQAPGEGIRDAVVITKPFTQEDLAVRVREALDAARRSREEEAPETE